MKKSGAHKELSPKELAALWHKKVFGPVYYLFGEDAPAKNLAIDHLKKLIQPDDFNLNEYQGDQDAAAGEVAAACKTPPMFSDRRLVVVRNVKFGAEARRLLADYLRDPLESSTLLMTSEERKPEGRDVLAAAAKALDGLVVFKALREGEATGRLCETARGMGFELSQEAANFMVDEAGTEWGVLRAELQKLKLLVKDGNKAGLKEVTACLGYHQQANPFDLPRLIQKREAVNAVRLLRRMLREGTDPYRVLYSISGAVNKQLKAKRMTEAGKTQAQIFGTLRLNSWYDKDFLSLAQRLSEASLLRAVQACVDAEVSLKSKSWLDPAVELDHLVLKVCGKR